MGNILGHHWQYATVIIRTEDGGTGTGVLVGKIEPVELGEFGWPDDPWARQPNQIFLVTARHVLGDNASVIRSTIRYYIDFNIKTGVGVSRRTAEFLIENAPLNWRVHPDPDVDIAALDVTLFVSSHADIYFSACPLTEIANPISLLKKDITIADPVFALGYPAGLMQGDTALPIARTGILATSPRMPLIDDGVRKSVFLVDGAIIPGSSGSPIICSAEYFRAADLVMTAHRPILLGIITDQLRHGGEYVHLGRAHHAITVVETLMEFDGVKAEDFLALDHDAFWSPALNMPEWLLDPYAPTIDATEGNRLMHATRQSHITNSGGKIALAQFIADKEFGITEE